MPPIRRSYRTLLAALVTLAPLRINGCPVSGCPVARTGRRGVRVTSNQMVAPIIGSYQGMRRDTLVVIEDGAGAKVWGFNTSAVSQVEVSIGMKGGNRDPMIRWGLIGAGIGGGHWSDHRNDRSRTAPTSATTKRSVPCSAPRWVAGSEPSMGRESSRSTGRRSHFRSGLACCLPPTVSASPFRRRSDHRGRTPRSAERPLPQASSLLTQPRHAAAAFTVSAVPTSITELASAVYARATRRRDHGQQERLRAPRASVRAARGACCPFRGSRGVGAPNA